MFKYKRLLMVIGSIFLLACNSTNSRPLLINFTADSTAITVSNIDPAGLFQIKNKINSDTTYQNLVSVLQTPGEDDSTGMELDWPGKLSVSGDSLLFSPREPFVKGKNYLVETIINTQFASSKDIVKSTVGTHVKAQQQILKR